MNIIILIFSFLTVMALSTASFWQTASAVRLEAASFCGSLTANRVAENALQKKIFQNIPSAGTGIPSPEDGGHKRIAVFKSHRVKSRPHQYARLQLAAIWDKEAHPFVESTFLRLLNELYGHTPWFRQANASGEIDALLTNVVRFGKSVEGKVTLHELFSALPPDHAKLLYKMVKGTHTYTLENKSGYPPLLDFVSFSSGSAKHTCRFPFASLPLLRALFDEKTALEILSLEKEKWEKDHKRHVCTKADLVSLLQYRPISPTQPADLDTYFLFSRQTVAGEQVSGKDTPTGIHTERRLAK